METATGGLSRPRPAPRACESLFVFPTYFFQQGCSEKSKCWLTAPSLFVSEDPGLALLRPKPGYQRGAMLLLLLCRLPAPSAMAGPPWGPFPAAPATLILPLHCPASPFARACLKMCAEARTKAYTKACIKPLHKSMRRVSHWDFKALQNHTSYGAFSAHSSRPLRKIELH